MLHICDVANKLKTLKNVGSVFSAFYRKLLCQRHLISLALVCQNPERLITILWFGNKF